MNNMLKIILVVLGLILLVMFGVLSVKSSSTIPEGIEVFYPQGDWFCIVDDGDFVDCYSCCFEEDVCVIETETLFPTKTNKPANTPTPKSTYEPSPTTVPTDKPTPTVTVTPVPTDKSKPTPTIPVTEKPKPTETQKVRCNSGRGNGSEGVPDCDPGNSGEHNQGGD